jgi:hypothetical protein
MLTEWNLEVGKFASKEETRYSGMGFVQIHSDKTVATNGHVLVIVTRPQADPKQVEPVLFDPEKLGAQTFDLDGGALVRSVATVALSPATSYPNWEGLFANQGEPVGEIVFNLDLLMPLLEIAAKHADNEAFLNPIRLRFYGPDKAMRVDFQSQNQGMTALIMPINPVSREAEFTHVYEAKPKAVTP